MKKYFAIIALFTILSGCIPYKKLPEVNSASYPVHSHNDYQQAHPLYDALKNGVRSVEVDVYHLLGPLWVCHTPFGTAKLRRIQNWYFRPLAKLIKKNGGYVYKPGESFYVFIEVKTNTKHAMPRLKRILARYKDIMTTYTNHSTEVKPVTVTILSERDDTYWMKDSVRYFGVELPFSQAAPDLNPNVYTQFRINTGNPEPSGKINPVLADQLKIILTKGQRIRANAGNDTETSWEALYEIGVTYIHTDKLSEMKDFMKKKADLK